MSSSAKGNVLMPEQSDVNLATSKTYSSKSLLFCCNIATNKESKITLTHSAHTYSAGFALGIFTRIQFLTIKI